MDNTTAVKNASAYGAEKKSYIKKHGGNRTLHLRSFFASVIFLALIIIEIMYSGSYLDEIICLVSIVYIFAFRSKIERRDMISIILLIAVVFIGLISNIMFGINSSVFSVLVDVMSETKLIFSYFAMKYFLNDEEKQRVIDAFTPLARIFTLAAFACSVISLFADIGMSGNVRYGLREFKFIFPMSFQYVAVYIFVFGILVCTNKMSDRKKRIYYILALISISLALKGPPLLFSVMFIGLSLNYRKRDTLSPIVLVLGIIAILYVSQYQIETYLLDEDSPRRLFFEYSFKTANNYFPLGSGFGTFGSSEAAYNYSPLYYQYGFHKRDGLNPANPAFTSDTFWPMAIGQFGWIGCVLYLLVYIRIFFSFTNNKNIAKERKAFIYAAYLQYMIHAVGSAILSSSAGMIGFMAIAMFTTTQNEEEQRKSRLKIHL